MAAVVADPIAFDRSSRTPRSEAKAITSQDRQRVRHLAFQLKKQRSPAPKSRDDILLSFEEELELYISQDDSLAESISDSSVATPDGVPSPVIDHAFVRPDTSLSTYAAPPRAQSSSKRKEGDAVAKQEIQSSTSPKMLASFTEVSDFGFDRYSLFIDPSQIPDFEVESDIDSESEIEDISPLEVAKPVSYSFPKSRPTMIRIMSLTSTNRSSETQRAPSPEVPSSFHSRTDTASSVVSDLSDSQDSSSCRSLKRKSSMLTLFSSAKARSRISTPRNFMRLSALPASPTAALFHIEEEQSRLAVLNENEVSSRRSVAVPLFFQAELEPSQQAAQALQYDLQKESDASLPATPSTPTFPYGTDAAPPSPKPTSAMRRKSFSRLRQRSESIGHALKFNSLKLSNTEPKSVPDLPSIHMPPKFNPNEMSMLLSPSPLTPRNLQRNSRAGLSPFFGLGNRSSTVDLRMA